MRPLDRPDQRYYAELAKAELGASCADSSWSFSLITRTSNEAGANADIAGFVIGQATLHGQLRAEREGSGAGRIYGLAYRGLDFAGNASVCSTVVTVPHDRSNQK